MRRELTNDSLYCRKHESVTREMSAIQEKLKQHDDEAVKLLEKKPPLEQTIIDSLR